MLWVFDSGFLWRVFSIPFFDIKFRHKIATQNFDTKLRHKISTQNFDTKFFIECYDIAWRKFLNRLFFNLPCPFSFFCLGWNFTGKLSKLLTRKCNNNDRSPTETSLINPGSSRTSGPKNVGQKWVHFDRRVGGVTAVCSSTFFMPINVYLRIFG